QLEHDFAADEHPIPLGVPAGERAVPGLHGGQIHAATRRNRPRESRVRRQAQSPVPLLTRDRTVPAIPPHRALCRASSLVTTPAPVAGSLQSRSKPMWQDRHQRAELMKIILRTVAVLACALAATWAVRAAADKIDLAHLLVGQAAYLDYRSMKP